MGTSSYAGDVSGCIGISSSGSDGVAIGAVGGPDTID